MGSIRGRNPARAAGLPFGHWDIRRAVVVGVNSVIGTKSPTRGLVAPRREWPDHEGNWGTLSRLRIMEGRCSSNTGVRRWAGGNGHDRTGSSAPLHRPAIGIASTPLDPTTRSTPSEAPVVIANKRCEDPPASDDIRGDLGRSGAPSNRGAGRADGAVGDRTASRVGRRRRSLRCHTVHRRALTKVDQRIEPIGLAVG
jgi:hypothetical protein